MNEADVIFVNTCAIRDNAEQRVRQRLNDYRKAKRSKPEMIIGVLGCMAERLKEKFLEEEKIVGYFGAGYLYSTPDRSEPVL
jgi:tRNA-2-methylthio-N6-dimethylallyladenosine synthase